MQNSIKKTRLKTILSVFLLVALVSSIVVSFPVNAEVEQIGAPQLTPWPTSPPTGVTPNVTIATTAFISVSPNPIGQGQTVLINFWLEPPVQYNRFFSGYTITVTKPNNATETR